MKRVVDVSTKTDEIRRLASMHPMIDQYITEVDQLLRGQIDDEAREFALQESAFWLERLATDEQLSGKDVDTAALGAINRSPQPRELAEQLIEEQFEDAVDSPLMNFIGRANAIAFGWFALLNIVYLIAMQMRIYMPSVSAYELPFSPAKVRAVWPEPLPFPEFNVTFLITIGFPILIPVLAGWIIGKSIPVRAPSAVLLAQMPITIYTFVMGVMMLPVKDILLYGVFQVVFWLPVGCLTAHLSSLLARRKRARLAQLREADGARSPFTKH